MTSLMTFMGLGGPSLMFPGRRRRRDVQFFMDILAAKQDQYILHVVSMDAVVSKEWKDATNPKTCEFWLNAIRQRHVIAFLGGPPCESKGRRWEAKELTNIHMVLNVAPLLRYGALLWEHWWLSLKYSVWGLLKGFWDQAKRTTLLTVNIPRMLFHLHQGRIRTELPTSVAIGRTETGFWRTTALKKWVCTGSMPLFCCCIDGSFWSLHRLLPWCQSLCGLSGQMSGHGIYNDYLWHRSRRWLCFFLTALT